MVHVLIPQHSARFDSILRLALHCGGPLTSPPLFLTPQDIGEPFPSSFSTRRFIVTRHCANGIHLGVATDSYNPRKIEHCRIKCSESGKSTVSSCGVVCSLLCCRISGDPVCGVRDPDQQRQVHSGEVLHSVEVSSVGNTSCVIRSNTDIRLAANTLMSFLPLVTLIVRPNST